MSHHTARLGDSKFREDGGRDIGERRTVGLDRPVAQQHARHQRVIHAVVATPGVGVVLENVGRKISQDGLPSGAVTAVVTDDQIRALQRIGTLIDLAGSIDAGDCDKIILRIAHRRVILP